MYSVNQEKRTIYLSNLESLTTEESGAIIQAMLEMDSKSHEDIKFYITSYGGLVYAGLAIIDVMKSLKSDVVTIGAGFCASIGAIILMSGTKGKRYVTKNTFVLIHQVSSMTYGKLNEMIEEVEHCKKLNKVLESIILESSKITKKQLSKYMSKDTTFNAEEAMKLGLIDIIYE